MMETKITKLLESRGVKYRLLPHTKPVFTCEEAAVERDVPLNEMIKCILLKDKKDNYYLTCITADNQLDTQKTRQLLNSTRLSFASKDEITDILGYEIGAIPPLLLKTQIPILFDKGIMQKQKVNISSGSPNAGIELDPKDLIPIVKPRFINIKR